MAVKYYDILEEFIRDSGAEGAVLVSVDGLAIASVLPAGADEDRVAAMGAAILSLGERKISDYGLIFEKSENWENIAKKVYLLDYEKKVLHLVDGKNRVSDIIYHSKLSDLIVKRTLYGFLACGIIQREKKKERKLGFDLTRNLLNKIISKIKGL